MKKLLILSGLVIFAIGFVLILSQVRGVDPKILFVAYLKVLVNFLWFVCKLSLVYAIFVYMVYRVASERKIRKDIAALPIPVQVIRLPLPGFSLPHQCDLDCKGVLVCTTVFETHSLVGADGKVYFPSSNNWCKIDMGLLAQYRQRLRGEDRLFCTDCGMEYDWRVIRPKNHPLNLYKILPQ